MKRTSKFFVGLAACFAGLVFMRPVIVDRLSGKVDLVAGRENSAAASLFPDIALKFLQESLQSYGGLVSATLEKQNSAQKELDQGDLNYQGTIEAAKGAAIADEKFSTGDSLSAMCAVAEDQASVMNAKVSSDLWTKAIVKTNLDWRLSEKDRTKVVNRALNEHYEHYCSDADSLRGRCSPSGKGMPNADIDVGTIFEPNFASTLSDEEYRASLAAARKIVGLGTIDELPPAVEKTPLGQIYLLEKRKSEARLSLADHTLARLIARRRSREDAN